MRHYDRTDFRHLNDAERYRDYDYLADDWVGPNERRRIESPTPSYEGRGPRRAAPPRSQPLRAPLRLLDAILHPRQTMERIVRALLNRLRR